MRFSQRIGASPVPEGLKPQAMPDDLRNTMWNVIELRVRKSEFGTITQAYWLDFIKKPLSTRPTSTIGHIVTYPKAWEIFKSDFLSAQWHGVYDRVEFLIALNRDLEEFFNEALVREMAAYRIVDHQVVPITSDAEIAALDEAMSDGDRFEGAQTHIRAALAHLSDRQNPNFRNSIKESISAVEATAAVLVGKPNATLGAALATLEKMHGLHGSLKVAYSALYGYTSDAEGIRHALMDEPNLRAEDAKFFLLICSSFVNYLKTLT